MTGWMTMRMAPAIEAVAIEMAKAMRLMRVGSTDISRSAVGSCETAITARPMKVRDRNSSSPANIASATAQGKFHRPDRKAGADVSGVDRTIVDAEDEQQDHFRHEQKTEEEREPAQGFLAVFLKRHVIDLVDEGAQRVESRQHQDARRDRIDAEPDIEAVSDIRAEQDEGRMRDVDDVEHAEGNRNAGRDGGIESAEQEAGDDRVDQEVDVHARSGRTPMARTQVHPRRARPGRAFAR